ncbi:sensor domain-containing diguanylate cyclase [Amphritea pacifica]|uniref:sensor domain-containing diguanylate cyclase n=1 Tax=Amphritea pacifica TaxID=2811233 RepID=UPI001963333F|nr:sensor domain-containing diguanylate cyclase [Amphritea pacifica]MBN1005726.1 GGDEF domain-containing protein [Amphritea pacifica]
MKPITLRKPSFILISSVLLSVAFATISFISYFVANNSLNQHIKTNTLPLTSDTVYSEVQRDLLQPVLVSSLMAQDTFVHDWIENGEHYPEQMQRYLKSIQTRYNAFTAFFVSEQTTNYYHSSGIIKQVSASDPADDWYFTSRKTPAQFDINLDQDTADGFTTTLFVNHKVKDAQGRFLGIIGVGLASQKIRELIEVYQNRYGRQIYFIDRQGKVTLQGSQFKGADDIHNLSGLGDIAPLILSSPGGSYSYSHNDQQYLIKTRFVPELDWYLIVEHTEQSASQITATLWINLLISLVVMVVVLLLQHFTLGGYQRRLEVLANTDPLTGTASRHAFELVYQQILRLADRHQHPVSTILVDIDHFKLFNDTYGHLLGDKILIRVARILTDSLRKADTLCRWGGDEFFIVLPNCSEKNACVVAEKMRLQIETSLTALEGIELKVTASFGVAEYISHESPATLFKRTDQALYRAKSRSRNQVEASSPEVSESI